VAFWVGIPTAFFMQGPWAWGIWSTGLAIIGVFLAYGLAAAGLVPRQASLLIGIGAVLAPAALWAFQFAGTDIEFGAGSATAVAAVGIVLFSAGLALVGLWLRAETPTDEPTYMATA
jgi:hypothetical protein